MLQNGVSHRCACVKLSANGGVSHHFGGAANLPVKVSRDTGYRSDSIAVSRDMGPLSTQPERVCPNCLCKILFIWMGGFWGWVAFR